MMAPREELTRTITDLSVTRQGTILIVQRGVISARERPRGVRITVGARPFECTREELVTDDRLHLVELREEERRVGEGHVANALS